MLSFLKLGLKRTICWEVTLKTIIVHKNGILFKHDITAWQ